MTSVSSAVSPSTIDETTPRKFQRQSHPVALEGLAIRPDFCRVNVEPCKSPEIVIMFTLRAANEKANVCNGPDEAHGMFLV